MSRFNSRLSIVSICIGLVLGLLISGIFNTPQIELANARPTEQHSIEERQNISVYQKNNQTVVYISTLSAPTDPLDMLLGAKARKGAGSGVIIDSSQGLVLTNLHVISEARKIEIVLADGKAYKARFIGLDREYDIAVLQILNPPTTLVAAEFGDSSALQVGQRVLAIGNPFGLNRTLTTGIVSSLNRTVKGPKNQLMRGLIQTDAAINPGNSGGPLLSTSGKLVGINTAILSQSGDSAGIGFAVPISRVKEVLPELIATGKVLRPEVGWILIDTNQGPMVWWTDPKGPAAKAGVESVQRITGRGFVREMWTDFDRGDLIYSIDGQRVKTKQDVERIVAASKGADSIEFVFRRGGLRGKDRVVRINPILR